MRILAAVAASTVIASLLAGSGGAATGYSLAPQDTPHWDSYFSVVAVYQKADAKQNPPRIYNPTLAIQCSNGSRYAVFGWKNVNIGGGWDQGTIPVLLEGSGDATCTAWLEYTDGKTDQTTILTSTSFQISY